MIALAPRLFRALTRVALLLTVALALVAIEGCATTAQTSAVTKQKKKRTHKNVANNSNGGVTESDDGGADGDDLDEDEDGDLASTVLGEGGASFYADSLAGGATASGEKYNPRAKTCAHKTLAFGTIVIVEDTDSGKWTRCRINDRGPFVAGRIIDLSKRTARDLGILDKGVAKVRIRVARPKAS